MRRKMKRHLHGIFRVSWNCLQVMMNFPFNQIGDYRYRNRCRYTYRCSYRHRYGHCRFLAKSVQFFIKDTKDYLHIQYKVETSEATSNLGRRQFLDSKEMIHISRKIFIYACPVRVWLFFFLMQKFYKRERKKSWESMKQNGNMGVMDIIKEGKVGRKERKRRAGPAW